MPEEQDLKTIPHVKRSEWGNEIWETAKIILISLAIVFPIRYFIAQPFIVRGASMEPNFYDNEYLIVDELSFYLRKPLRGEVIVFRFPRNPAQFFIKRIIGLPGETVELEDGRVKIINEDFPDGFFLDEFYLGPQERSTWPNLKIILGPEEYFVLGDNRYFSSDSRVWGGLDERFIVGRAFFRVWPIQRLGVIQNHAVSY